MLKEINHKTYKRYIKKNTDNVFCLLIYSPFSRKLSDYISAINKTRILTCDSIKYFMLKYDGTNTERNFNVKLEDLPCFVFVNKTNRIVVKDQLNPKELSRIGYSFISEDNIQFVDDFWVDDYRKNNTVIYFTDKHKIPSFLKPLQKMKNLKIGVCDDIDLMKEFTDLKPPALIFYGENKTYIHDGPLKYRFIRQTAISFLNNATQRSISTSGEYRNNLEFPEICFDVRKLCLLLYDDFIDPEFETKKNQFTKSNVEYFFGRENFPLNINVKPGMYIIYNYKKDGIIVLNNITELNNAFDRIIDGTAKYQSANLHVSYEL